MKPDCTEKGIITHVHAYDTLKEYIYKLRQPIYTGKRLEENLRIITYCGGIISLISGMLTVLNIMQDRTRVAIVTTVIFICGIVIIICAKAFKSRRAVIAATLFLCIMPFTDFAVRGVNEGFAILWTLLVPLALSYFLSVRAGLLLGVYYELLFIALFYTPMQRSMTAFYSTIFMQRYPVLFFCDLLLTAVSMISYHIQTLEQIAYESSLEAEVERQTKNVIEGAERLRLQTIHIVHALTSAIDAKDQYTNGHSERVSMYSARLAARLGWSEEEIEDLRKEALLHDVGKIGVPDAILNKPGKLEDDEFLAIKEHTLMGDRILTDIQELPQAALVARHHHERYDGKGYPDGLKGDEIPSHARVVSIADAYDAMFSDRIYRKGLKKEAIRDELIRCRGRQFDPEYTNAFLDLLDSGELSDIDYIGRQDT